MKSLAVALAFGCIPAPLVGQATRWAVRIESISGIEHGELRLDGKGGRLLLESRDSAYITLTQFEHTRERVHFAVTPLSARVTADLSADGKAMSGWWTASNGARRNWQAEQIMAGTVRWPVRPRVRVKQLLFGSGADVTIIPASWVRALPDSARLEAEYQQVAEATRLPTVSAAMRGDRSRAMVLGADDTSRALARGVLEGIAARHAADTTFQRIFVAGGGVRLDLHERAEEFAGLRNRAFEYGDAARALVLVGEVPAEAATARGRVRLGMLSFWSRWRADDTLTLARVEALQVRDRLAWRALTALLEGYDQAVPWWEEAVRWLMEQPWLETPNGFQAPDALVAKFWGQTALRVPDIAPELRGGFVATPLVAGDRIARRLIEPLNASAREWLATERRDALTVWGRLRWDDTLTVGTPGQSATLLAPVVAAQRASLGSLLAAEDRIEIDPGIVPIFAVVAVIHEWHHLLATATRLSASDVGTRLTGGTVQLREEDPWLAEGFAEWATEETLRPTRRAQPLIALADAEKRISLWGGMSDDPHALGYRLVRAATARLPAASRRSAIVNRLHDPAALARLVGFATSTRTGPLLLRRPMTLAVIPEITFTWDAGVADHPTRRLLLPLFPPEH